MYEDGVRERKIGTSRGRERRRRRRRRRSRRRRIEQMDGERRKMEKVGGAKPLEGDETKWATVGKGEKCGR